MSIIANFTSIKSINYAVYVCVFGYFQFFCCSIRILCHFLFYRLKAPFSNDLKLIAVLFDRPKIHLLNSINSTFFAIFIVISLFLSIFKFVIFYRFFSSFISRFIIYISR